MSEIGEIKSILYKNLYIDRNFGRNGIDSIQKSSEALDSLLAQKINKVLDRITLEKKQYGVHISYKDGSKDDFNCANAVFGFNKACDELNALKNEIRKDLNNETKTK